MALLVRLAHRLAHHPPPALPAPAPLAAAAIHTSPAPWVTSPARRLPLRLVRLLGAECPLCGGLGCEECAWTGFR